MSRRTTVRMARPGTVYLVAECEAGCSWFRDEMGRKDTAAARSAARRHIAMTGHTVRVETTVARQYRPPEASRTRGDEG